jgi:hypothetical protein
LFCRRNAAALDARTPVFCRTMASMRRFYGGRPFTPGRSRGVIVFAVRKCGVDGQISPDPSEWPG